tara:strand:- start:59 stop:373 length:315 start_codon:yes stop_codon:yes gene_type:complete
MRYYLDVTKKVLENRDFKADDLEWIVPEDELPNDEVSAIFGGELTEGEKAYGLILELNEKIEKAIELARTKGFLKCKDCAESLGLHDDIGKMFEPIKRYILKLK